MSILAGDIGGTKTLLQLKEADDVLCERRFDSTAFDTFDALLAAFFEQLASEGLGDVRAGCIGVAGPVDGRLARVTNLPWRLDADALAARFGISRLQLINDFQAVGYGLATLSDGDLKVLQPGQARAGAPRVLIGAGTGLGEGILVWAKDHYEVLPSEGGHVDFAPTDEHQRALLAWLSERQPRVSYEHIVSGPGLETIYRFHAARFTEQASALLLAALDRGEGAVVISQAAEQGDDLAAQTLDMFMKIYGAQAGNLALTCLAAGGVYIAGGIAPRMAERLTSGVFMAAFCDKGKMGGLVAQYPVYLVMNPRVGLLGAAEVAARLSR
ncbi:MAG: glucokinase [Gammaproteobacteria bacterium]|nr:glucokinase [Gammaproteobacteria bacterium]MCF6363430.1 glucokinase [Gammaproteobacteria bacterium]